jgi:hypothetical protein
VPAEKGLRSDQEGGPSVTWEDPSGGREEGSVDRPEPGPGYLPAQDPQLVAQDSDLGLLVGR